MDVSRTIPKSIAGKVVDIRGSSIPFGYLKCDGAYILRASYPRLFEAIGTTYNLGGDSDVTKFRLPNFDEKISIYEGSTFSIGQTGGANTHVLTESEMPSHTHVQNAHNHSVLNYVGIVSGIDYDAAVVSGASTNVGTTNATNQNTGGGVAHNNIMPSVYCLKIIKF